MGGWISLHRKMLNNPIVCKDSDYFSVWCYLLLNATHDEYDTLFKGKRITLKKGQLITGRKVIAEKFKIDESKVQRVLKKLEIEQQIEQQTSPENRLVSILNWELYQNNEQQNEQQVNNDCTTSEQQVNTNNNGNKVNKVNKYIYTPEFEEFYSKYPRPQAKQDTFKNWNKLIKEHNVDYLIACLNNYFDYYNQLPEEEKKFAFASNNFLGQKAYYKDFENPKIKSPQDNEAHQRYLEMKRKLENGSTGV